jgi:tetratricopeptide (TPR) repeat protein
LLDKRRFDDALRLALSYRDQKPADELAWIALGDCYLGQGELRAAARAYGSLIDLAGDSGPKRRAAGNLLEAVASRARATDAKLAADALALAVDTYRRALERRPDQPSSYQLYALSLAKQEKFEDAFEVLSRALGRSFEARFSYAKALLAADLGLVAAAWAARDPSSKEELQGRLRALHVTWPSRPELRFVLTWETDTSDVGLHVKVGDRRFASGRDGGNVRDGYGPEAIVLSDPASLPQRLGVSYDRRGFQGHALGKVTIIYHDGDGGLRFDERPFVLMNEHGYADLGEVLPLAQALRR